MNRASVPGRVFGLPRLTACITSEQGVVGLALVTLENVKDRIRVNAVCPGVVDTPVIDRIVRAHPEVQKQLAAGGPVGRLGAPDEIASAVVWLCSDAASFVTGQAIAVDGGWVAQ